ncbi:GHKL domain-containing protein [Listeria kieliensis]
MMMDHLPNIPRLYTALSEWLACLLFLLPFLKKRNKVHVNTELILFGLGQIFLQYLVSTWSLAFWIPGMLLNIAWMFGMLFTTGKLSLRESFYLTAKAFIVAEFTAAFSWQLYYLLFWKPGQSFSVLSILFVLIVYAILFGVFYLLEQKLGRGKPLELRRKDAVISMLTATIVFITSNIGFGLATTSHPFGDSFSLFFIRTLVNLTGICILYIQETQRYEYFLKKELVAVNHLFEQQYDQYVRYKESSSAIQQKTHDLKHQINALRFESDQTARKKYLDEMSETIAKFEASISTGNAILDTILTQKNAYCLSHGITFSCLVDGKLLAFMDTMDICSLFGNALDNAIEAVMQQLEQEKRLVKLNVMQSEQFLLVRIDNYSTSELTFHEGMPKTTKVNQDAHGYGLKSIAYIANKYHGVMTIDHKENWFTLKILMPLPKK